MRSKLTVLAGAIAIAAVATACSSSPTTKTGTETWQAKETGASVVSSSGPAFHLKFTGPVNATSTWTPPNNDATKSTVTFKTSAGNLTVNADLPQNANPPATQNAKTCVFVQTLTGTYTVVGSKSTGSFKGATGHGTVKSVFSATLPKLSNGSCNQSQNAQPLAAGAYATLYISGPLTVTS